MMKTKTKAKELLKILQADGWQVVRINGSHHILKHPTKPGMPIIPMHNKDVRIGTYKTILKQAGFDQESGRGGTIYGKIYLSRCLSSR